jgi:CheY-like chemotaxis protein/pSer/pThr/pTyr-binding forkhead associated (FHA) protein
MISTVATPWIIELHAPHLFKPIKAFVDERITIGRSVSGADRQPDVDLGASDSEDHPVAPEHISLYCEHESLMVMDMGSERGTLLNGQPLTPFVGERITHGDQLRLGRLTVDVQVILSPNSGIGGMHYRPGLNLYDETPPGDGEWVLIVERDSQVARVLAQLMERTGYDVKVCQDVVGAMRVFSQSQPDAIILDLNLEDMDGLELCRYVRRDVLHNSIPILAINPALGAEAANTAMDAGADVVMNLPLDGVNLRDVVLGLVNHHDIRPDAIRTRRLPNVTPFHIVPPETHRQGIVLFVHNHESHPITLIGSESVSFGRQQGTDSLGGKRHIDLSDYDAANCGVSRVHMFIHCQDGQFYIEDVGSRNHTYINGEVIPAFEYASVKNSDEIRLGNLRMYVYLFEDCPEM